MNQKQTEYQSEIDESLLEQFNESIKAKYDEISRCNRGLCSNNDLYTCAIIAHQTARAIIDYCQRAEKYINEDLDSQEIDIDSAEQVKWFYEPMARAIYLRQDAEHLDRLAQSIINDLRME